MEEEYYLKFHSNLKQHHHTPLNQGPFDQLTIDAAALGSGGTGTVVVTIATGDLTGDVLTMVGSTIAENGGEIYSAANNPGGQLNLSYTSTSTKTAVAS